MKYITVTQENKIKNKGLFKGFPLGSIYQRGLPNSFNGVVNQEGNYQNSPNHVIDGWFDFIEPTYNPSVEKLGALFFDNTNNIFTKNIIGLTQQEQDNYTQRQEDQDESAQLIEKYKSDGVIAFDRAYALIERRRLNGALTNNQAKALAEGLYPSLEPLYKGIWQLVKINLSNETPPANAALLSVFTIIKNYVDNYVTDNY